MSKNEITATDHAFLESVSDVLLQARKNAKTAVNLTMVYAYYEIGRIIVEEEQRGEQRAAYGQQLLRKLSDLFQGRRSAAGQVQSWRVSEKQPDFQWMYH